MEREDQTIRDLLKEIVKDFMPDLTGLPYSKICIIREFDKIDNTCTVEYIENAEFDVLNENSKELIGDVKLKTNTNDFGNEPIVGSLGFIGYENSTNAFFIPLNVFKDVKTGQIDTEKVSLITDLGQIEISKASFDALVDNISLFPTVEKSFILSNNTDFIADNFDNVLFQDKKGNSIKTSENGIQITLSKGSKFSVSKTDSKERDESLFTVLNPKIKDGKLKEANVIIQAIYKTIQFAWTDSPISINYADLQAYLNDNISIVSPNVVNQSNSLINKSDEVSERRNSVVFSSIFKDLLQSRLSDYYVEISSQNLKKCWHSEYKEFAEYANELIQPNNEGELFESPLDLMYYVLYNILKIHKYHKFLANPTTKQIFVDIANLVSKNSSEKEESQNNKKTINEINKKIESLLSYDNKKDFKTEMINSSKAIQSDLRSSKSIDLKTLHNDIVSLIEGLESDLNIDMATLQTLLNGLGVTFVSEIVKNHAQRLNDIQNINTNTSNLLN